MTASSSPRTSLVRLTPRSIPDATGDSDEVPYVSRVPSERPPDAVKQGAAPLAFPRKAIAQLRSARKSRPM